MNTKKTRFNPKKIPYYLLLSTLTVGASLILGFLSFSGMYALLPILPLAFLAFVLSVSYEGEIYLQNIKGSLEKLLKTNHLQHKVTKEYLLTHFPEDLQSPECPQFFKDYNAQLQLLSAFGHQQLNKESKKRKKHIEKTLNDMEKRLALLLFSKSSADEDLSEYVRELKQWLVQHEQAQWKNKLSTRQTLFNMAKGFGVLAALFMGMGTTYLIIEAFSAIPLLAAIPFALWPVMILPMALIAGAAYGFLTYNAVTDLINHNTIKKWYIKLRDDLNKGLTARNVLMTITAISLVILATALTICTAGTWWTIATNARPLFDWMKNIPSVVMGVIHPIITGVSALFFNVQNTAESLSMVDKAFNTQENIFQKIIRTIKESYASLRKGENWAQTLNPFRILLKITITPLRLTLFLGHLISIAFTADRMPGVPQIVSALVAIITEGFEDAHYFMGHDHDHPHQCDTKTLLQERLDADHGHNHDLDIPTLALKTLASPIYLLAATWDYLMSQVNPKKQPLHHDDHHDLLSDHSPEHEHEHEHEQAQPFVLSFKKAWNKHWGTPEEKNITIKASAKRPSEAWQKEQVLSAIAHYKEKHLSKVFFGQELAHKKHSALSELQSDIQKTQTSEALKTILQQTQKNEIWGKHRLFSTQRPTITQAFIEELPHRVNLT